MNPLIQNFSRENNFKLLSQRLTVDNFEFFVRGSTNFTLSPNLLDCKFTGKLDCRRAIFQYPNTIDILRQT